jgi:hypothetical protein
MECATELDAAAALATSPLSQEPVLRNDEHERLVQKFHQITRDIQSSERELDRTTGRGHVYRLKLLRQGLSDMRQRLLRTQTQLSTVKVDPWDECLWGHILASFY